LVVKLFPPSGRKSSVLRLRMGKMPRAREGDVRRTGRTTTASTIYVDQSAQKVGRYAEDGTEIRVGP